MTKASTRLAWLGVALGCAVASVRCVGEHRVSLLEPGPDASRNPTHAHDAASDAAALDTGSSGGIQRLGDGGLESLRATACVGWTAQRQPEPAVLELVVDVSGSMNQRDPSGDGTTTKWQVVQPALRGAVTALPPAMGVGLLHYPNLQTVASTVPRDSSACVNVAAMISPVALGTTGSVARRVIDSALQGTLPSNEGGTPTHDAYLVALRELASTSLPGNQYVLLMTDGQPTFSRNCIGSGLTSEPVDVTPIIEEISAARLAGVGTFVIGAPGSEQTTTVGQDARPWLSRAAEAGGTAKSGCSHTGPSYCHFDMVQEPDFATGLHDALAEIAGRVVNCSFALPAPPAGETLDRARVNVVFTSHDGQDYLISQSASPTCDDAWRYSEDGTRIVLCDTACKLVQSEVGGSLELLFGCETLDVVH